MYQAFKSSKASKRLITLLIGTTLFSFNRKKNNDYNRFALENENDKDLDLTIIHTSEEKENLEVHQIPRLTLFNIDKSSIINMIYFPIQYSLFFFYETLNRKYANCAADLKKPYLGCSIRFNEEFKGMRIINVKSDSPAERVGIKVNDIIVEIDGKRIMSINDYISAIGDDVGEKTFRILRVNDKGERVVESFKINLAYES